MENSITVHIEEEMEQSITTISHERWQRNAKTIYMIKK
jgi:hypothetical protein